MCTDPLDLVERAGLGLALAAIAGVIAWVGIAAIAILVDW